MKLIRSVPPVMMMMPSRASPQRIRFRRSRIFAKLCRISVLIAALSLTILVNLIFIMDTGYKLKHIFSNNYTSVKDLGYSTDTSTRSLTLEITSSQSRVSVSVDGSTIMENSEEGIRGRGIHVLVLNQVSGAVMAHRVFDTYSAREDEALGLFLNLITKGRIIVLAVKDEGSFHLKQSARNLMQRLLGSVHSPILSWRDMWVIVSSHKEGHSWCEQLSPSPNFRSWGPSLTLTCQVPLVSFSQDSECQDQWDPTEENQRRKEFCSRVEGYGSVCHCELPAPISFQPIQIPDNRIQDVPVAVIASNRPHYLYRMLRSLLSAGGVNASMVTVFIDGFFQEPMQVVHLFGLKGVSHIPLGKKNGRISQHYKASLSALFKQHPSASHAIVVEEDLDVAPDFFYYFSQLKHLLDEDPTLYCISAWNDHGYQHSSSDVSQLYRVETMPGLGWMLTSRLFKEELEHSWPTQDKMWDWDMWMRKPKIRKDRECIIPDIPRTYHFGASGFNMNSYFQDTYFRKRAINNIANVRLRDVESLISEKYENVIEELVGNATVLDHSVSPCLESFIPDDVTGNKFVMFISMLAPRDTETWLQVATCFKIWDLDARGSHKGLWRFYLKSNAIFVIGYPYSPYSKYMPSETIPIKMEATRKPTRIESTN